MRVGVSYRSTMSYTLDGNRTLGAAPSTSASADLKLPDTVILSVWQQVSDRWEAMGDLSFTRWNTLDKLNVRSVAGTETESFNYDNSWRIAWGAAYKASDAWKVKFGIAYDRTPTSDDNRTARTPDNDRLWFSFGGQWNGGVYGRIDAGYAYLYMKDPSINQTRTFTTPAGAPVGISNLRGSYNDSAHVLGIQYSNGF
jgi:long-chain fatty acid transport protein